MAVDTTARIKVDPSPPPDSRLAAALAYCAARKRQLDRAAYLLPRIAGALPDATVSQLTAVVDIIAGAPLDLLGEGAP